MNVFKSIAAALVTCALAITAYTQPVTVPVMLTNAVPATYNNVVVTNATSLLNFTVDIQNQMVWFTTSTTNGVHSYYALSGINFTNLRTASGLSASNVTLLTTSFLPLAIPTSQISVIRAIR